MTQSAEQLVRQRLNELQASGRCRQPRTVDSLPSGRCVINGRTLINFGSNDYLSLAHHPDVCQAFADAAARQAGSGSSSLITGRSSFHDRLEQQLADFEECEAALLFPTGFAANLGAIHAMVRPQDVIFSERENHASLIDGVRSTKARVCLYDRHHLDDLVQQIEQTINDDMQGYLITDGVFSMDGTVAPLAQLCDIAERYQLAVLVDEAHGTGVLGTHGRGACELEGVEDRTFLRIGTLSKALGALGGFAAGSRAAIEWLRNRARPQFFSTALPPAVCASAAKSLEIVQQDAARRQRLADLNRQVREYALSLGLSVPGDGPAPIVPVVIPDEAATVKISQLLQQEDWFVPGILPPTVPAGTSRLRVSLSADHQLTDVTRMLDRVAGLVHELCPSGAGTE